MRKSTRTSQQRARRTRGTGRRRLRRAVVVTVLALVAPLAQGSLASADDPASNPATPDDTTSGHIRNLVGAGSWASVGNNTLRAAMPGNLPGTVSVQGPSGRAVSLNATSTRSPVMLGPTPANGVAPSWSAMTSAWQGCFTRAATASRAASTGTSREVCATDTAIMRFDNPVVDPVIRMSSGFWWTSQSTSAGCWVTFAIPGISLVNGQAPAPGQVTLAARNTPSPSLASDPLSVQFVDNHVQLAGSYAAPPRTNTCSLGSVASEFGGSTGAYWLQVKGVVSSLAIDSTAIVNVYKAMPSNFASSSASTFGMWPQNYVAFTIPGSDLSIEKTAVTAADPGAGATVEAGEEIEWGLTVQNNAFGTAATGSASHGFVIHDAVPPGVTDVALSDDSPPECSLVGSDVTCTYEPPGYTVTQNSTVSTVADLTSTDPATPYPTQVGTVFEVGDSVSLKLTGKAPPTGPATITNTAWVAGVDVDPNVANNKASVTTRLPAPPPTLKISKTATVNGSPAEGGIVRPGDLIEYTVTARAEVGAVSGVTLTDDLSNVLQNATFVSYARLQVGDGAVQGIPGPSGTPATLTAGPFTLQEGQTATLTYRVQVGSEAWLATLTNTASATSTDPSAAMKCTPTCSTTHKTGALVQVQKTGLDQSGAVIPLDGAAFRVLSDDAGTPGAVVPDTPVLHLTQQQAGAFRIEGLMPGTYWLDETTAPTGYELLAAPIAFTIGSTGTVTLVDAHANPNVTASGNTLTVGDAPKLALPYTGTSGATTPAWPWGGAALAAMALISAALWRHRRAGAVD